MNDRELFKRHGHLLTHKEREVFELYIRGLSQRTIALAVNLTRSGVVSRLETATRRLHQAQREETTA